MLNIAAYMCVVKSVNYSAIISWGNNLKKNDLKLNKQRKKPVFFVTTFNLPLGSIKYFGTEIKFFHLVHIQIMNSKKITLNW